MRLQVREGQVREGREIQTQRLGRESTMPAVHRVMRRQQQQQQLR